MTTLSVVVPIRNERANIEPLIGKLDGALTGIDWEVIFVDDDSRDGTAPLLRDICQRRENVRCLQRVGRFGLASACIEGVLASASPYIAVMDGDLQHDETVLPTMLNRLQSMNIDIVVGTRFGDGGSVGNFAESRQRISRLGTVLSRLLVPSDLTDPMSGFFMMRREFFDLCVHELTGKGFKILLDLFASCPREVRFDEVPFRFRERQEGRSKLDLTVALEYLLLIADKTLGHIVPIRFIMFLMVGSIGVVIHLLLLTLFFQAAGAAFMVAQGLATFGAMTFNFFLNNILTYRDRRLHGRALANGLISFYLVCGAGALINVEVSETLFENGVAWAFAGLLGAGVSAIWNYAVTATFTWNRSTTARWRGRRAARRARPPRPVDSRPPGTGV